MGKEIWNVLAAYEGKRVAVDREGKVVAAAETLPDVMLISKWAPYRLTYLYAAPETGEPAPVRS
jgi:hypothetical protein